jgi:hypothetical protein
MGVELALEADVKHLCLYHNEPLSTDRDLTGFLEDTKRLASLLDPGAPLRVSVAWDGMIIQL